MNEQAVLVTTEFRGVFFGYASTQNLGPDKSITLSRCKNCIYWDATTGGFLGLAAEGPGPECRVGKEAESVTLYGVTCVAKVGDVAAKRWASA